MEGKRRRIWPYRRHTNKPTKVQSKLQRDDTMTHSRQTACGPVFFLALGELLLQLQDRMADSSNHAIAISPDCLFHDRSKHMQRCKCCWYSPRARAQNQRKQACWCWVYPRHRVLKMVSQWGNTTKLPASLLVCWNPHGSNNTTLYGYRDSCVYLNNSLTWTTCIGGLPLQHRCNATVPSSIKLGPSAHEHQGVRIR